MEWVLGAAGTLVIAALSTLVASAAADVWRKLKESSSGRGERSGLPRSRSAQVPGPRPGHAAEAVPNAVPLPPVHYVNRAEEAAWADASLLPLAPDAVEPQVRIGAVSGLPGMGKSALMATWAKVNKERFPGGQLYVNFAELPGGSTAASLSEALAEALAQLKVGPRHLPDSLAGRTRLYRELSERHQLLVVLDQITEAAQVRALLPSGSGSAVFAAGPSRIGELALLGARLLPLKPLAPEHGLQLLTRVAGDGRRVDTEPEAARLLVEFCGGLPVALGIVGARLAVEPQLRLGALVAELSEEERRLEGMSIPGEELGVSSVLEMAYRRLPADTARLYGRLGLLPGPRFDAEVAAAVDGVRPADARLSLARLESAGLIEVYRDGRHGFPSLVRLHAQTRGNAEPEPERRAALTRVIRHYVQRVAQADEAVMGPRLRITDHAAVLRNAPPSPFADGSGKRAALAWLSRERAELLAVHEVAARLGEDRAVWQMAEGLTALFLHHRHVQDWIASGLRGVAGAARNDQPAAEARLAALTSRPLIDLDRLEEAQELLERAAARLADIAEGHMGYESLPVLGPSVLEFTGRLWDRLDPPRAVETYEEALARYQEAGEARGAAIARYLLGCALDAAGRRQEALVALRAAVSGFESLPDFGDQRMAGRARGAMGGVLLRLDRRREALAEYIAAANSLATAEASHYEALVREELAALARQDGDTVAHRDHLIRAVGLYEREMNPRAAELRAELSRLYPGQE